jgi:hypothetical protein
VVGAGAGVRYVLDVPFPATAELDRINRCAADAGFEPRQRDILNPQIPNSVVRGWTRFFDSRTNEWVSRWQSQWENSKNELLSFTLEYRSPGKYEYDSASPTNSTLHVHGALLPKRALPSR